MKNMFKDFELIETAILGLLIAASTIFLFIICILVRECTLTKVPITYSMCEEACQPLHVENFIPGQHYTKNSFLSSGMQYNVCSCGK